MNLNQLQAIIKRLQLVDSSGILANNSLHIVLLHLDFAMQQFNTSEDQRLQASHQWV